MNWITHAIVTGLVVICNVGELIGEFNGDEYGDELTLEVFDEENINLLIAN